MSVSTFRGLTTEQQSKAGDLTAAGGKLRLNRHAAFWAIAASMAVMTAFSTAPSPLYGIYQRQDSLSSITITIVYAVYAVGIITSLLLFGHVSDWYGRRPILIPAILTALAAAVILSFSTALPALIVGRVLTGLALGAAIATATAYLTDLDADPGGPPTRRSEIVATIANTGGLALGPLVAGLLVQNVRHQPRLPYVLFATLLLIAVLATMAAPEGRPATVPRPRYRPQRLALPSSARVQFSLALTGVLLCFTVFGVLAGLGAAFLAGPLRSPSPVLAGLTVFISFGIGTLTQAFTITWSVRRLLATGIPLLVVGMAAAVAAAWVEPPSLALYLVGAAVLGIGCGAIFRGTLTIVMSTAAGNDRAGALASYFVCGYLAISLPVVSAGIVLTYISLKVIFLAIGVTVIVATICASPVLLSRHSISDRDRGS